MISSPTFGYVHHLFLQKPGGVDFQEAIDFFRAHDIFTAENIQLLALFLTVDETFIKHHDFLPDVPTDDKTDVFLQALNDYI